MEYLSENRAPLSDYMTKSLEERKAHTNLEEPCLEIGANSSGSRALLAVFLNTTCETLGMKTGYLCHACGNSKCSNPRHHYWGTCSENNKDRFIHDPGLAARITDIKIRNRMEKITGV
jgi:hypothetical protein